MSIINSYNTFEGSFCDFTKYCNNESPYVGKDRVSVGIVTDYQIFATPYITISGFSKIDANTSGYSIYNASEVNTIPMIFSLSGDTYDLKNSYAFPVFNIIPYDRGIKSFVGNSDMVSFSFASAYQRSECYTYAPDPAIFTPGNGVSGYSISVNTSSVSGTLLLSADTVTELVNDINVKLIASGYTSGFTVSGSTFYICSADNVYGNITLSTIGDEICCYDVIVSPSLATINKSVTIKLPNLKTDKYCEWIIKPSFIYKDKLQNNNQWFDTLELYDSQRYDHGVYDAENDYYFVTFSPPSTATTLSSSVSVEGNSTYLKTDSITVMDSSPSGLTYTFNLTQQPSGEPIVSLNGVTLSPGVSNPPTGDIDYYYDTNLNSILFSSGTVITNDIINVTYVVGPSVKNFYKQSITITSPPSTSSGDTIYRNAYYYYINLSQQPIGSITMALNGVTLGENVDFILTGSRKIQFLNPLVTTPSSFGDFMSGDTIQMNYLTTANIVGTISTKSPTIGCKFDRNINYKESVNLVVYDYYSGNTIYNNEPIFEVGDTTDSYTYNFTVPYIGTFSYFLLTKRYYTLINGHELISESKGVINSFSIDAAVFYRETT